MTNQLPAILLLIVSILPNFLHGSMFYHCHLSGKASVVCNCNIVAPESAIAISQKSCCSNCISSSISSQGVHSTSELAPQLQQAASKLSLSQCKCCELKIVKIVLTSSSNEIDGFLDSLKYSAATTPQWQKVSAEIDMCSQLQVQFAGLTRAGPCYWALQHSPPKIFIQNTSFLI